MSLQFSVRYLHRSGLLGQINDFAQPVILLGWQDEYLEKELQQCGCEVYSLIKVQWGPDYERARSLMNLRHQRLLDSPSTAIRERRQNLDRNPNSRLKRTLRRASQNLKLSIPGAKKAIRARESGLFLSDTNSREVEQQLQSMKIDAVLSLTPFLVDEEMMVRVSSRAGIPTAAAILSFDNLTTRPWIPITFDSYLLWNRHNADQLRRGYPQAAAREVKIVGTPQFDFYWKPEYLWSETEWRSQIGIPQDRPVLLFAGGYVSCAPHEPQFLGQLDDAIEANEIPGKPIILFRRHPVDPMDRWQPVLNRAKHIILDNPWHLGAKVLGHTNIGIEDIRKLASTLYYSNVHVNVASTMTVDGAIFDKYQVGPAYDDSPGSKYHRAAFECYQQEHFLPIIHSGGMDVASSRKELIQAVRTGFTNPQAMQEGRQTIVREICTFNDGKCTQRVASALREFVDASVPRAAATTSSVL